MPDDLTGAVFTVYKGVKIVVEGEKYCAMMKDGSRLLSLDLERLKSYLDLLVDGDE